MAGRPIGYERGEVVQGAMAQFWARGFGASDVDTLTQATGLNRHSLYKAFGGKRGLFLDALRHYVEDVSAVYANVLETGDGLADIVAYFERITRGEGAPEAARGFDQRGCLLVNTAIELGRSDPQVAELLDAYYARIECAFAGLIRRGQDKGTIRRDLDPLVMARWLRVTGQGLSVSSRIGMMPGDLADVVRMALSPQNHREGERG
jgi:TetR/AcrR family transcriptional repressor of nem operon